MKKISFILLLICLTACGNSLTTADVEKIVNDKIASIEQPSTEYSGLSALSKELEALSKEAMKSTFMISCYNREEVAISSGSGALFSEDNDYYYGFTNYHVVDDATTYKVSFSEERSYDALIVGTSKETDLAVVKIAKKDVKEEVKVAKFASYDDVKPGQLVLAIGTPNGLMYFNSVTLGVVSGVDRMIEISDSDNDGINDYTIKMIQHDAAINHGNSGGPLFNLNGEIIGVNTLKIVINDTENVGCAIACDYAKHVTNELLTKNVFEPVTLGVYASVYSVFTGSEEVESGVQIKEIIPGGSVEKSNADIQVDDILFELNGKKISDSVDIKNALFTISKGTTIEAKLYRKGEIVTTTITF